MSKAKDTTKPTHLQETKKEEKSIDTRNLKLTYSDGTKAVNGISLQIPKGEFFGFLGPNGAGKTTFIKMLVTLLNPTSGKAKVNGYSLKKQPQAIRETIGYVAQETSVDEELTARENIRFACEAYGVPKKKREKRINELLELVELSDVANKRVKGYSGGMKKRLDVATALVHEPPLVFLDEPTAGLDPKSRKKLWDYFERINAEGRTIFLTTQYLEEADQLCDRIAVIQEGEIISTGSPTKLKQKVGGHILEISFDGDKQKKKAAEIAKKTNIYDDTKVDFTDKGIKVAAGKNQISGAALLVELQENNIPIKAFNLHEPTLNDVFLTITGKEIEDKKEEK